MLLFSDIFEAKDREWDPKAKAVLTLLCEFYAVNGILDNCGTFLQVSSKFDCNIEENNHIPIQSLFMTVMRIETLASWSKTVAHSQITVIYNFNHKNSMQIIVLIHFNVEHPST